MSDKPYALSVKVVVIDDNGRCLLLRRSTSSKNNPGMWDLPGGKLDPGETFEEGLLREVSEETGLEIKLDKLVGSAESESPSRRIVYLIMQAQLVSGDVRLSDEHEDCAWVCAREAADMDVVKQFKECLRVCAAE